MKKIWSFRITLALCCFSICLLAATRACAQVTTADIVGTVTDTSGAVVPNAKVTIENTGTHETHTALSNASGDFTFNFLQPGSYSVSVEAANFQKYLIPAVVVGAGDRTRADAKLEVGASTQTVEVTASISALQTDSSTQGSVVPERTVQNVPLNGRNYISLIQNTVGINAGPANGIGSGNRPDDRRQTSEVSANGESDYLNNNMIDGMDNNEREQGLIMVRPAIDAIQEVRVDTSVPPATIGRAAGANINVITRAGTNTFHGSAYEFLRNDIFDANDYFANKAGRARPEYRQNQFGGSVGGPIRKNKTFFFADVEELRIVQGSPTGLLTVPTLYERQHPGDFTDQGGVVLPPDQIDPVALQYFNLFPLPNVPGATFTNNYSGNPLRTQTATTVDGRVDNQFSNGDSLFVRYSWNPVNTFTPGLYPVVDGIQPGGGAQPGPNITGTQGIQVHYVHTFSPRLVMELGTGFGRVNIESLPLNYGKNVSEQFGMPNSNISLNTSGLAPVVISGYTSTSLGDSQYIPLIDINNVYQYAGALTYTKGTHNIKVGAGVIRRQLNYNQYDWGQGLFTFSGTPLASITNFLKGTPTMVQRTMPNESLFYWRFWEPNVYVQDDWRATRWLTINAGLRWDYFSPETEAHNHRSNFDLNSLSMIVASDKDPTAGVKSEYKNFAPRIGFAASGHNMVLRGGFGLVFFAYDGSWAINLINPPYYSSFTCNPGSTSSALICPEDIGKISQGVPLPTFGSISPLSGEVYEKSTKYPTSYVEQFNLALQRQFGQNVVTVAYVGQLGRHQYTGTFPNLPQPKPGPPQNYVYAQQLPLVNIIFYNSTLGTGNYNAGQLIFERRYTNGLVLNANYTLAHGLNDFAIGDSPNVGEVNGNMRYDYGNSDYDVRQRFNILANYTLPFFKGASGFKRQALTGWSVNALAYAETGLPFMVLDTAHSPALINLPGITSDRPNRVPGAQYKIDHRNTTQWFNTAAFVQQPQGTAGNAGRNQVYAPATREIDASVFKDFPIHEALTLQFRAEAFNLTNTENFAAPHASIGGWDATTGAPTGAGSFGQITSSLIGSHPRQVQFALKLSF